MERPKSTSAKLNGFTLGWELRLEAVAASLGGYLTGASWDVETSGAPEWTARISFDHADAIYVAARLTRDANAAAYAEHLDVWAWGRGIARYGFRIVDPEDLHHLLVGAVRPH